MGADVPGRQFVRVGHIPNDERGPDTCPHAGVAKACRICARAYTPTRPAHDPEPSHVWGAPA